MKTELFQGHSIRFIEVNDEYHAVAQDVAKALNFRDPNVATRKMPQKYKGTSKVCTPGGEQIMITLTEKGVYRLIMRSNKPEAEAFQDWVYEVIKQLRQQSGLEAFQAFKIMDSDHQKQAMTRLKDALQDIDKKTYIKAQTIANKAVSTLYGHPKMIAKKDMTLEMLEDRKKILDEVVKLIIIKDKYGLDFSVGNAIYEKVMQQVKSA